MRFQTVLVGLSFGCLLTGCAQYASDIPPAAISDSRYDGWSCQKMAKEKAFVDDALVRTSAEQDSAASRDTLMVAIVGVPTSGGGVKGEGARLKGEQNALHEAMLSANCL